MKSRFASSRTTSLAALGLLAGTLLAHGQLPSGWTDTDIGVSSPPGSAAYSGGVWTVAGGGADIWNTADQFNFCSTNIDGDCTIVAQVLSLQATDPSGWSKQGVMFRSDDTAGAMFVNVVASQANGVCFQWRTSPGGNADWPGSSGNSLLPPVWVKLVRSANQFSGYYSADGANWTLLGSQTVAMDSAVLAGLAVTSHNEGILDTATFSGVAVGYAATPPPPPPPTVPVFGVYRQEWINLDPNQGDTLFVLTNTTENPNWPDNPDPSYTTFFSGFETEVGTGRNNYGQRLRAFVVPPMDGNYVFWIASDDTSDLFVSSDENPAHEALVANVSSWTDSRAFYDEPTQQSPAIPLRAHQRYYVEALMQQGGGGDNLAVQWQLPDGTVEVPLATGSGKGTLVMPCTGVTNPPGIYLQPTNITVVENQNAALWVMVTNQAMVSYYWQLGGTNLDGANAAVCLVSNVTLALNNGQVYSCVVSNAAGSVTSTSAVLTVLPDTTPPRVVQVFNLGLTNVGILFSKPVGSASATDTANYVFTNGLPVTGAVLTANNTEVILSTAPLAYGSNYLLVLNGVQDRSSIPNTLATNTLAEFAASPYLRQDIGNPPLASSIGVVGDGLSVTACGSDIGGDADQFNFEYQNRTGDFDLSVCVASLSVIDPWAKAGLMARESLDAGGRFAAALATPAMNGSVFEWRDPSGSASGSSGSFPANYPNTWLRLQRVGDAFNGFASYDGLSWTLLGSDTISMPAQIYVGFAVDSHLTNQVTTAQFVNFGPTSSNAVVATVPPPGEPIGPSSRKSCIAISEIMYKPATRADGYNLEFLELYNSNPWFYDLSGFQIVADNMNYTVPAGTIIAGGAYLVIAASPASMQAVYGITNVLGPYAGSLKKSGTIKLLSEVGAVLLTVPYSNLYPWPVAADGTGHSIVLANPSYGEGDPRAWDISDTVGGSPGQMEAYRPSPLRSLVINEFLAHSENPAVAQFVELYNHSAQAVDISGCILTDDPATNKCVLPDGTWIPAAGFVSLRGAALGFALNGAGGTFYLLKPDGSRVLDAVRFEAQADGVSYGRWPDGANDLYPLRSPTPGTNNGSIAIGQIVINELMYKPISGNDDDQYVELYNQGANAVSLANWQFTAGISYTFPTNTTLAPGGYLVLARNLTNLWAKYTNLNSGNTLGNYSGKLSHSGERVALAQPEWLTVNDGQGGVTSNQIFVVEDEVTYSTAGRWGQWASGGGSSLELIDPRANHRLAANWADSDETQKSAWVTIQNTGVLDNGQNYDPSINYAQIGLLDVGECLVDNIEVDYNGVNYVSDPLFQNHTSANWSFQGCMTRSSVESPGYASNNALHIRCSDRLWTGVNSCQVALTANSLTAGQTVTMRFKARWLRGWPEALFRLNGNWLEATGALPVPTNLGTPGQPNSQRVANAGPAIYGVTHSPSLPAANQPAVVLAKVHDPDGVANLTLYYRLDPATTYTAVPMTDDGNGGDAIAGDGIYSATIPGQAAGTVAAFFLAATDQLGAVTRFPAVVNDNSPVRECVVMFGDGNPGGSFGVYHLWITQTNINRWAALSDLSNESSDCTFVNNSRVIYNLQGRFAGSPYHQDWDYPNGALCHYKWTFFDDDKFLGETSFNKIHQPGNGAGDDASLQREQTAYTFMRALGVSWLNRRFVAVYVNGNRRGPLMEDAQCPDGDMVDEDFPNDSGGFLFKMQPWFEFAPFPSGSTIGFNNNSWCNLMPYPTTGGALKTPRYRLNFLIRRTADSANDFTNVFSLVEAASSYGTPNYVQNLENLADMENWMRVFAANHAAGNWDAFGCQNAQNLYGYIGTAGTKYSLMMWDYNIVLGNSGSWGPGQSLFALNGQDTNMSNIFNEPAFRRMYWRALQQLVNGPLANSGPLVNAKYHAFVASGLTGVEDPNVNILPWLSQAQASIASQLAATNATQFAVNSTVAVSNDLAYVTGIAPVAVKTVLVNGAAYPITWTSVTGFRVSVPLAPGTNLLSVTGLDLKGQPNHGRQQHGHGGL